MSNKTCWVCIANGDTFEYLIKEAIIVDHLRVQIVVEGLAHQVEVEEKKRFETEKECLEHMIVMLRHKRLKLEKHIESIDHYFGKFKERLKNVS